MKLMEFGLLYKQEAFLFIPSRLFFFFFWKQLILEPDTAPKMKNTILNIIGLHLTVISNF